MSKLSMKSEVRDAVMGPLAVGVVILIIWFFVIKPMVGFIVLAAVVALFYAIINYFID